MKKTILVIAALYALPAVFYAQVSNDLKADSAAIITTALNYGDGFYSGDAARMEKAISPDLNKVCPMVMPQTGKTFLIYSSYSSLIELSRAKVGLTEEAKRKISVKVLRIDDNIACARLTSASFNDYLEMVKIDGQWKIVNVLWTFGPDSPNRKVPADFAGEREKPAVEQAVRDLIEGIYTSDMPRVEKVLYPEFKRATLMVMPQTGKSMINRDAYGAMVEAVRAKVGAQEKEKWSIAVEAFDFMDGLAFAELTTPSGLSYCQLAKIDGQWKIINMLRKTAKPAK